MSQMNGKYQRVKLFSSTMKKDRDDLDRLINEWLDDNDDIEIVNTVICQSSDNQFHCYTMTIFYNVPPKAKR